jgi:hypothetical protein
MPAWGQAQAQPLPQGVAPAYREIRQNPETVAYTGFPGSNLSQGGQTIEAAPTLQQIGAPTPHTMNGGVFPGASQFDDFDYSKITKPARLAIYDDLHSAPRVIQIPGGPTHEFIERIASLTYDHAKTAGGNIPYSVIREVSENFIHARFEEVVISVLDGGNTISFTDQGPGIKDKELVQKPGITSATEPMKRYIRGVGSGLPLVRDALDFSHGTITIADNVNKGTVVTISLEKHPSEAKPLVPEAPLKLSENDKTVLGTLLEHGPLGVTEVGNLTGMPVSSVHASFGKLANAGLVEVDNKKRQLTEAGREAALRDS